MGGGVSFFGLAARSFWLWFGAIWLLVGSVFLVVGVFIAHGEREYQQDGQVAQGVVLTKSIRRADRDSDTEYRVSYRFTTSSGQRVEGRDSVSVHVWEALREQEPVQIQYLPRNPSSNRIHGQTNWVLLLVFGGMGAVFAPVGGFLSLRSLRKALRERRLWSRGMVAEATVTGVRQSNVRINRRPLWIIDYEYRDHFGQTHQADSGYVTREEVATWQVGDTGHVRHDSQRPEQSVWISRSDYPTVPGN